LAAANAAAERDAIVRAIAQVRSSYSTSGITWLTKPARARSAEIGSAVKKISFTVARLEAKAV
jgi:hypothetical protein